MQSLVSNDLVDVHGRDKMGEENEDADEARVGSHSGRKRKEEGRELEPKPIVCVRAESTFK